jgi:hypothetical protein
MNIHLTYDLHNPEVNKVSSKARFKQTHNFFTADEVNSMKFQNSEHHNRQCWLL